jgi:ABC-type transporter Mla maintaining outer membrane lipid asymmetry permease subunit MlaE
MNIEIHEMVYCKKLKKSVDWQSVCNSQERCAFFGGIDRLGLECNFKDKEKK